MATYIYLCLILLSPTIVSSETYHEEYMEKFEHLIENLSHNMTREEVEDMDVLHDQHTEITGSPFPCTVLPPSPAVPTSVHALRPGDIKVVAAMGDSITAGLGADASNILGLLTEYRGLSWSIGGDGAYEDQETLPNILKKYNPDLKGFSIGTDEEVEESRFNVAITGSIAGELPGQARELINRMKNDPTVDFENDWKIITIMTGGNDICDVCFNEELHSPATFVQHMTTALDMLKAEVPRVFVNLVETINVEIAKDLNKGIICTVVHVACRCAAFPDGEEGEQIVTQTTQGYHTAVEELVNTGKYDTSDDFTVVVQPFLKETFLPRLPDNEPDMSFFAPDCFHLSKKGQGVAANGLWNNMIEPEGQKRLVWSPGEPIECPTEESPFFFTRKNSNYVTDLIPNEIHDLTETKADDVYKTADDSPKIKDNSLRVADDSPEVADAIPDVTNDSPERTADNPEDTDDSPDVADDSPEGTADNPEVTDDSPEVADDTNPDTVNRQVKSNYKDKRRAESNTIAIGTTFVALAVLGLILTVLWTIQNRLKNRRHTGSYEVMDEGHKH